MHLQDAGTKVANIMKSGVRATAGAIESVTDAIAKVAPDSIGRDTIKLVVQIAAAFFLLALVKSFFAVCPFCRCNMLRTCSIMTCVW